MKYCLAIDIGASSGRHILGSVQDGKMIMEEIYRFPNGPTEKNGHLVWDIDALFFHVVEGLKKANELGKIPTTVGVDTWGVDYALLSNGKIIGDMISYRDARTDKSSEEVEKVLPFTELYQKTGIEFAKFNTVYQLYDDLLSGKMDKAEDFLQLPDYLHYLLTGVKKNEYTNATTTGLVNAKTHTWDYEIIDKLGFKRSLFKELSQPGTIVGEFSKEIQDKVGYNATVVLPATHDTASAVLAVPDETMEELYISSGTWSLMGVVVKDAITKGFDGKVFSNEGSIDFNFRYQTNIMGMWIFQNVKKEIGQEYSFQQLTEMAEKSSYSETFNVNDKRFFAPKSMSETILNYFKEQGTNPPTTLGDMCRSVFLSLAKCYAETASGISLITGKKFSKLFIIGGGSQNKLLNKFTQQSTGLKVYAGPTEATAVGNITIQLISQGIIKDIYQAKKIIKNSFEITEI